MVKENPERVSRPSVGTLETLTGLEWSGRGERRRAAPTRKGTCEVRLDTHMVHEGLFTNTIEEERRGRSTRRSTTSVRLGGDAGSVCAEQDFKPPKIIILFFKDEQRALGRSGE